MKGSERQMPISFLRESLLKQKSLFLETEYLYTHISENCPNLQKCTIENERVVDRTIFLTTKQTDGRVNGQTGSLE